MRLPLSLLFSPNSISILSLSHRTCLLALLPASLPSSGCFQGPEHPSCIVEPRTAHSIQGGTVPTLNVAWESPESGRMSVWISSVSFLSFIYFIVQLPVTTWIPSPKIHHQSMPVLSRISSLAVAFACQRLDFSSCCMWNSEKKKYWPVCFFLKIWF